MSLRYKYWTIVLLLHSTLLVLIYHLLLKNKWFFILSEVAIIISLYLCFLLYRALIKPIELMYLGGNAIRDRDFNTKFLHTGSKEMDQLIDIYNTMIERLGEERTMAEEQSIFLENLIRLSPVGMVILDYDGRIDLINKRALLLLGIEQEDKRRKFSELQPPATLMIDGIAEGQHKVIRIEGNKKYRCHAAKIIHKGFLRKFILIEDLTTELLQSEKEAYGRIIRMMAHEVNNSMGAVNSILQTVHQYGFDGADADRDLKDGLEVAMERNTNLTTFMKNFAKVIRISSPILQQVELNGFLENSAKLWLQVCKENNIILETDLTSDTVTIMMDPVQMEQVISNIIKNSIESIGNNGFIRIRQTYGTPGFVITDNGAGISDTSTERIFTPFYSSKPQGQGVGLMVIREILDNHGARYKLGTDKKDGLTSFEVKF